MFELPRQRLQFLVWLCIAPVIFADRLCVTAACGSLPTLMSSPRGRACACGGGTALGQCCCFGNLSLLTVLASSWPEPPCQLGHCWLRDLVPVQRGWPWPRLEDEASWVLRLPGCSLQQRRADT